jgi:5-formyltetrahydrofolate cyclo-ligase
VQTYKLGRVNQTPMSKESFENEGKSALRARMQLQLLAVTSDDRTARSEKICARVVDSREWQNAKTVILFSSLRTEPEICALESAAIAERKSTFVIPRSWGVEADLELPFAPELILVPGLAFSPSGSRLGRGGGFYDRLLGTRAGGAFKLGICFGFQVLEAIPTEPHDARMNRVISE